MTTALSCCLLVFMLLRLGPGSNHHLLLHGTASFHGLAIIHLRLNGTIGLARPCFLSSPTIPSLRGPIGSFDKESPAPEDEFVFTTYLKRYQISLFSVTAQGPLSSKCLAKRSDQAELAHTRLSVLLLILFHV